MALSTDKSTLFVAMHRSGHVDRTPYESYDEAEEHDISIVNLAADLLFSKILRRHPTLKFALSEGGIGWVPYFLERADYVYQHHRAWTHQDFGKQKPSECFRDHILNCFIDDKAGLQMRDEIGVETIFWECDYPHSDTTWPLAPEILWQSVEKIPDADVHAITHENAMREFRFDYPASRPMEKSTVAALRAESPQVDITPIVGVGGTAASDDQDRVVTGGDIMRQLAGAFVERT